MPFWMIRLPSWVWRLQFRMQSDFFVCSIQKGKDKWRDEAIAFTVASSFQFAKAVPLNTISAYIWFGCSYRPQGFSCHSKTRHYRTLIFTGNVARGTSQQEGCFHRLTEAKHENLESPTLNTLKRKLEEEVNDKFRHVFKCLVSLSPFCVCCLCAAQATLDKHVSRAHLLAWMKVDGMVPPKYTDKLACQNWNIFTLEKPAHFERISLNLQR